MESLLKEHSKAQSERIVAYIGKNQSRFTHLIKVFLQGPYRVTQRAAWPLSIVAERQAELVKPHIATLVKNLKTPGHHDAVIRNTLRLLQFVELPPKIHGVLAQVSFGYLQDNKAPIAVKVFAMSVLARLAKVHPELGIELKIILEDQMSFSGPGFLSRARKVLKQIG